MIYEPWRHAHTAAHTYAQSNFIDSRAEAIKSWGGERDTQAAQDADSMCVCVCVMYAMFMFEAEIKGEGGREYKKKKLKSQCLAKKKNKSRSTQLKASKKAIKEQRVRVEEEAERN